MSNAFDDVATPTFGVPNIVLDKYKLRKNLLPKPKDDSKWQRVTKPTGKVKIGARSEQVINLGSKILGTLHD